MRKRMDVAAIVLAMAMGLAGCSGNGGSQTASGTGTTAVQQAGETAEGKDKENKGEAVKTETAQSTAETSHSGFLFQSGDVIIGMNEDVAPILSGLGDYSNYAETPSCAFEGLDKIYSYNGFDLYTYPKGSTDYVNSIYFIDDSVATPEGIRLGSTVEEMLAAYGEDYVEEYGVYTYTKEKSTLSFIVTDGVIESIEYVAITE